MREPTYRIEAYTKYVLAAPNSMGCCRCSRKAEFTRIKYRNRKGAESYQITGFCEKHADRSVIDRLRNGAKPATVSTEEA